MASIFNIAKYGVLRLQGTEQGNKEHLNSYQKDALTTLLVIRGMPVYAPYKAIHRYCDQPARVDHRARSQMIASVFGSRVGRARPPDDSGNIKNSTIKIAFIGSIDLFTRARSAAKQNSHDSQLLDNCLVCFVIPTPCFGQEYRYEPRAVIGKALRETKAVSFEEALLPGSASFCEKGEYLSNAELNGHKLAVLDFDTGKVLHSITINDHLKDAQWCNRAGKIFAKTSLAGVAVVDPKSGKQERRIRPGDDDQWAAAVHPFGNSVLFCCPTLLSLEYTDPKKEPLRLEMPPVYASDGFGPQSMVFSPRATRSPSGMMTPKLASSARKI